MGENEVKRKKYLLPFMSVIVSVGMLIGCGVDEDEPDPTEEPSEQVEQDNE